MTYADTAAEQLGAEYFADPYSVHARLRERSLGVLEGTAHKTISPSATGLANGLVIDPDARPAAGESVRDLDLRAATFCDDLTVGLRDGRDKHDATDRTIAVTA